MSATYKRKWSSPRRKFSNTGISRWNHKGQYVFGTPRNIRRWRDAVQLCLYVYTELSISWMRSSLGGYCWEKNCWHSLSQRMAILLHPCFAVAQPMGLCSKERRIPGPAGPLHLSPLSVPLKDTHSPKPQLFPPAPASQWQAPTFMVFLILLCAIYLFVLFLFSFLLNGV